MDEDFAAEDARAAEQEREILPTLSTTSFLGNRSCWQTWREMRRMRDNQAN